MLILCFLNLVLKEDLYSYRQMSLEGGVGAPPAKVVGKIPEILKILTI